MFQTSLIIMAIIVISKFFRLCYLHGPGLTNGLREIFFLRKIFDSLVLPNSKKLWRSMQRSLVDTHFMMLLEVYAHPKFLRIRQIPWIKISS